MPIDPQMLKEFEATLSPSEAALLRERAAALESPSARQAAIEASIGANVGKLGHMLAALARHMNSEIDEAVEAPRRQARAEALEAAAAKWREDDLRLIQKRAELTRQSDDPKASPAARATALEELQALPRSAPYTPPPEP